ncbi:hypothetical protein HYALB_00011942 [Hymenoscyphus albidus]|uniref:FAD-binding PCMH-type domain-containing protein n=1 Tax=Hymenoscyphus albidus TaxID=595503 RepID=A0A9N9Q5A4_9HELO|nr:hypothetical protein HYALB_00011942 [Hymenoscyphus albidus]
MAKSAGLIVSSLLFATLAVALPQQPVATSAPEAAGLEKCLEDAKVKVIAPQDPDFANNSQAWQTRITTKPVLVAFPNNKDELKTALSCALAAKVKVSPLGGAHSFAAYGYGNDGNLVLNMTAFNDMKFDTATSLLTYGAGNRVGPVAKFAWDNYQAHFPHVRHGRPGLSGSTIGGGFGTTSRHLGTPMDNLECVTYMLFNGTEVTAKKEDDLFFATQGAASSYGVLTSLTTKTHKPQFPNAITFNFSLSGVDLDTGVNALLSIQEFATTLAPDELAFRFSLPRTPENYTGTGYFYGDPATFDSVIAPLQAMLPPTAKFDKQELEFWALENLANPGLDRPNGGSSPGRTFYIQALTTTADKPLTKELVTTLFNGTTIAFNRNDMSGSGFLDLWGGVSRDIKDGDTSYKHGNNLWLIRLDGTSKTVDMPKDGVDYMKSLMLPFEKALTAAGIPLRGFANYRDTALSEAEWSERLYGAENFERLKKIKAVYDPVGMFTNNQQSIPLPAA